MGVLLLLSFLIHAQRPADYSVHANILYHFTKYINWPPQKKSGDFIIGVLGESQIYPALEAAIMNKRAGEQRIVLKQLNSISSTASCHIVFLVSEESHQISKLAERTAGTSTLIVTESEGLARRGSCINFVISNNHLKLEINRKNIERRNLGIATELLQLGKVIE